MDVGLWHRPGKSGVGNSQVLTQIPSSSTMGGHRGRWGGCRVPGCWWDVTMSLRSVTHGPSILV